MTKKEFLDFYYAKKYLKENDKLIALTELRYSSPISGNMIITPISENKWLPDCEDLKEEFAILKKELKEVWDEANRQKEVINKITQKCQHEVRREVTESYGFGYGKFYYCVFCDKKISKSPVWNESININNHVVNLVSDISYDGDDFPYKVEGGYSKNDIYNIINQIIQNLKDDENIDFIKEFAKLNLEKCKITDKKDKKEYYVMIIAGSNKEPMQDFYLSKDYNLEALDFFKYFSNVMNCKILYISNNLNDEVNKIKNDNYNVIEIKKYTSIKDLESILDKYQEIPFNLIVNLSELSTYKVIKNNVKRLIYNLNLQKRFPNATVYNFKEESEQQEKDSHVITYDSSIFDRKYFVLEDDKYVEQDVNETCCKLKRELKK